MCSRCVEVAAQLIAALGTVGAIFLALFQHRFSKLRIGLHDKHGELTVDAANRAVRYYHVRVWNEWRTFPARKVRLLLTRMYKKQIKDDEFWDTGFRGALEMNWQFPADAKRYPTIGPDALADLCYLTFGDDRVHLCPRVIPSNFEGVIMAGYMLRLELVASSDYNDSNRLWLDISWDGRWDADDATMAQCLQVRVSRAPSRRRTKAIDSTRLTVEMESAKNR
jgi:hypothetical protein